MNEDVTYQVLQAAVSCGVREFVVCPGSRNSSFVEALRLENQLKIYYWPEERSAAFFALGRSRLNERPCAVVTTSGTAAGELLPAAMEAFYLGIPLLLITADRPFRFRGCGSPQSAEQVRLFGHYTKFFLDVNKDFPCNLQAWNRHGPAHINVCLEEPQSQPKFTGSKHLNLQPSENPEMSYPVDQALSMLNHFLDRVKRPLVIVSSLKPHQKETVAKFLLSLNAPAMLEAISGLREDPRLQMLRITHTENILQISKESDYAIDGILRIGGIPTHRIWRDLEFQKEQIRLCNISETPFSGISWNRNVIQAPIHHLLNQFRPKFCFDLAESEKWRTQDRFFNARMEELFVEEPLAEPALIRTLSKMIPHHAHVYLGNSLPIREWDRVAVSESKELLMTASRGLNGIDGQISTFLGLCHNDRDNWAILGDLTALYDLAGCWILPQLQAKQVAIAIINNGGGKIFEKMYPYKEMLNLHSLTFEPLAKMWGLDYEKWESQTSRPSASTKKLLEIIPDDQATQRFWSKLGQCERQTRLVEINT